jgi:hypothetical protein
VCDFQPALLGNDRTTHGGCKVIYNKNYLGGMCVQFLFEGKHDGSCYFRLVMTADSKITIGFLHVQIGEQRGIQTGIILSPGVDETV